MNEEPVIESPQPIELKRATFKDLNPRQRKFVTEYLKCGNASESIRRAGYAKENAHVTCSQMLANISVKEVLQDAWSNGAAQPEQIIARLSEHAFANPADFITFSKGNKIRINKEAYRQGGHAVKKLRITKDGAELEMVDSHRSLELLSRIYGMAKDGLPSMNIAIAPIVQFTLPQKHSDTPQAEPSATVSLPAKSSVIEIDATIETQSNE